MYGTSNDVYVVKKSGGTYSALTTLTGFANYVSDIKITPDKTHFVVASMSQFNVFAYDSSDDSITEIQQVTLGSQFWNMKI